MLIASEPFWLFTRTMTGWLKYCHLGILCSEPLQVVEMQGRAYLCFLFDVWRLPCVPPYICFLISLLGLSSRVVWLQIQQNAAAARLEVICRQKNKLKLFYHAKMRSLAVGTGKMNDCRFVPHIWVCNNASGQKEYCLTCKYRRLYPQQIGEGKEHRIILYKHPLEENGS